MWWAKHPPTPFFRFVFTLVDGIWSSCGCSRHRGKEVKHIVFSGSRSFTYNQTGRPPWSRRINVYSRRSGGWTVTFELRSRWRIVLSLSLLSHWGRDDSIKLPVDYQGSTTNKRSLNSYSGVGNSKDSGEITSIWGRHLGWSYPAPCKIFFRRKLQPSWKGVHSI